MEETKIKLSALLGACLNFKNDPNSDNEEVVNDLVGKLVITDYMPIRQKQVVILGIMGAAKTVEQDAVIASANYQIGKVLYGIFGYITNLDVDLDFFGFDYDALDMVYSMGVVDKVLAYCEKDYHRLEEMLSDSVNFTNLVRLTNTADNFSSENIDRFIQTIKDMKSSITPENLEIIKTMMALESPEAKELKDALGAEALTNIVDSKYNQFENATEKK